MFADANWPIRAKSRTQQSVKLQHVYVTFDAITRELMHCRIQHGGDLVSLNFEKP